MIRAEENDSFLALIIMYSSLVLEIELTISYLISKDLFEPIQTWTPFFLAGFLKLLSLNRKMVSQNVDMTTELEPSIIEEQKLFNSLTKIAFLTIWKAILYYLTTEYLGLFIFKYTYVQPVIRTSIWAWHSMWKFPYLICEFMYFFVFVQNVLF
jgi:hypothetical protein